MKSTKLWEALSKIQHQIAEILPVHGGKWEARLRQEAKLAEEVQKRLDERDAWRIPAQNWLKLVELGQELTRWNDTKMIYEKKAAESQKELSRISRQWQETLDKARNRVPPPASSGSATTTLVVDWNGAGNTGRTTA